MTIYRYQSYVDYLADRLRGKSHTKVARALGYRSKRSIGMLVDGSRIPSTRMALKLSTYLKHTAGGHLFLTQLLEVAKLTRAGQDATSAKQRLSELNPLNDDQQPLSESKFRLIADWHHLPLKELTAHPDFREDFDWISKRLRNKISTSEIFYGLMRLEQTGLIRRGKSGRLERCVPAIKTSEGVPNAANRSHHRQMLQRAIEALDEQGPDQRESSSLTILIDPDRTTEAIAAIREFRESFRRRFTAAKSSRVCQLNLQFFAHTD